MRTGWDSRQGFFTPRFGQKTSQEGGHEKITLGLGGRHKIPDRVRVPYIEGDGIGPEIMDHARRLVDTAVADAYEGKRSIEWVPLLAGEQALAKEGSLIPKKTVDTINEHHMVVKGPLNTPTGKGFRSVNVQLRNLFDLYACIRPVKNLPGVVTPMKVDNTDVVIFRENTEDVYKGIEFESGNPLTRLLITVLNVILRLLGQNERLIRTDSGIGIKPISETGSKRILRKAFDYALETGRPSVTVVHKGNIQKFTEGAFWNWAEDLAEKEYAGKVITQEEFGKEYGWDYNKVPKGKFVLQNRIADAMLQDVILNPKSHHVVVTMNLNGDYLSDAFAATVGGLGVAPGANVGDTHALFESTHGSGPDIAGQNKANPTAMFLTMIMMLNWMGWGEAADRIVQGINEALEHHEMTGDLARHIPGTKPLSTSAYTEAVINRMTGNKDGKRLEKTA